MRRIITVVSATISLSAALSFAACGSSDSAKSAVAPSSVQPSTLGATIAGNIVSGPRPGLTVSVAGTAASARVDDTGAFTLEHVPAGDQVLGFAGPAVNAHLAMSGIVPSIPYGTLTTGPAGPRWDCSRCSPCCIASPRGGSPRGKRWH